MTQPAKTIAKGRLVHKSGKLVAYEITHGRDLKASIECDRQWKQATVDLLTFIVEQAYNDDKLSEVMESISMEDDHWNWFTKAVNYDGPDYEWFHLHAEGKPQGACVIYHPKDSALGDGEIFYVEFIAVAPWNRKNIVRKRTFKGVGRALLRAALRFAIDELELSPGFCLHSLPKARDFYLGLNMIKVEARNKGVLPYFELPAALAEKLLEVA